MMMMMKIMPDSLLLQIFGFHIIFCKFILCTFYFVYFVLERLRELGMRCRLQDSDSDCSNIRL